MPKSTTSFWRVRIQKLLCIDGYASMQGLTLLLFCLCRSIGRQLRGSVETFITQSVFTMFFIVNALIYLTSYSECSKETKPCVSFLFQDTQNFIKTIPFNFQDVLLRPKRASVLGAAELCIVCFLPSARHCIQTQTNFLSIFRLFFNSR